MNRSRLFRRFGLGVAAVLLVGLFPASAMALPTETFDVTITGPVVAGDSLDVTVTAHVYGVGAVDTGYLGTIHFTSSDGQATAGAGLPLDYTFDGATDS